jgi:hypothetical protein
MMYNRVGRFLAFFTFSMIIKWRSVVSIEIVGKTVKKKIFHQLTSRWLCPTFWVMHYIRVKKFFFTIWTYGYQKTQNFM